LEEAGRKPGFFRSVGGVMFAPAWFRSAGRLISTIAVVAAGLALRRFGYDLGLSFVVVKYGGSALWGALVYLLLGVLLYRSGQASIVACAFVIAACVELLRLYHSPWLDSFRLTTVGALLLGRVFSLWNILAYFSGIGFAALLERLGALRKE
jgi:hypothetical protein